MYRLLLSYARFYLRERRRRLCIRRETETRALYMDLHSRVHDYETLISPATIDRDDEHENEDENEDEDDDNDKVAQQKA